MKHISFTIIIIIVVFISAFAAGRDQGRAERNEELQKAFDASIMVKKKHKHKQIELPTQEYKAKKIRTVET